ncbi:hypothetical protein [Pontibacter cellulosilyticus]|uniref:Magnesium citrate secondary transporter n=1 Tax=Pontibacter cellulosilyticus TaxID=1720253 RepID=A0A923N7K3_9BACT|nr:hypothetical protein [Pontibacter cellulosilyticus]MBC5994168.1 hypothetical protein [Pontibacter cellulosilyticus]
MNILLQPVFLLSVVLFCLNQGLEQLQLYIWPLHTHLDDLLCLPVVLTLILAAERVYFRNPYFVLPRTYTISTALLFSLVFELLLPVLHAKYTSDIWDVAAYGVGAAIFEFWINEPAAQVKPKNETAGTSL